jgi:small subunit ribosomal protein S7
MPRRRIFGQRETAPDPRYHDKLVSKFINVLMFGGKKSTAERVCYGAFDVIQEKTGNDPLKVFRTALDNVKPIAGLPSTPRRVAERQWRKN